MERHGWRYANAGRTAMEYAMMGGALKVLQTTHATRMATEVHELEKPLLSLMSFTDLP